jgi:putative hydrolase of the HAD superfamily
VALNSKTVVVFDLDDTLYKERDYVESGITAVLVQCQKLRVIPTAFELNGFKIDTKNNSVIRDLLRHLKLPSSMEQTLLWTYRLHAPKISLTKETRHSLEAIKRRSLAVAIITDGRSFTQRLKIKALGLENWPAFISEEYSSGKPDPAMFEAVVQKWPGANYAYVADNVSKDFICPNKLGWNTIGLLNDGTNIHPEMQSLNFPEINQPKIWIESLNELVSSFFKC